MRAAVTLRPAMQCLQRRRPRRLVGYAGRAIALVTVGLWAQSGCTRESTGAEGASEGSAVTTPLASMNSGTPGTKEAPASDRPSARGESTYKLPPPEVVEIVDAPPTPRVLPSPDGRALLLAHFDARPSIARIAQPFERLAGIRIDPHRNAQRRIRLYEKLELVDLENGSSTEVSLPAGFELVSPAWSPDGKHVAFARWVEDGLELWVLDAQTGEARRLSERRLNDVLSPGFTWMPGSEQLLAFFVPKGDRPAPERSPVPIGPVVEDTQGRRATNRTYQDLLRSPADAEVFEHLATSELAWVPVKGGPAVEIAGPDLYRGAEPSPDGRFLLVHRLRRPFSYAVPYFRFSRVVEVMGLDGKVVRVVADQDSAEEIPIGGVRTGARRVGWNQQVPATLVWIEALDEGDPDKDVAHRDRLMIHHAPFADVPEQVLEVEHRLVGLTWLEDAGRVLVREYDRDRRWATTWLHDLDSAMPPRKLIDRSVRDVYSDPGHAVQTLRPDGTVVAPVDDESVYFAGQGHSPEGARPFLDRLSLVDGSRQRVFESDDEHHEEFVEFVLGERYDNLLVRRESPTQVPNYYVVQKGKTRQVTRFEDPHPQLTGIDKKILKYRRDDGVELSGTLYLPPGRAKGERLPLVVWAYPLEYNDKETAGQVRAEPRRFTRLAGSSPLMFLTQGYAVLDHAAMPIVGDPETMNDTFVRQVVASAKAAVDAVVAEGVADPERVGVAGHSYGAFMVANLLAHSDIFKAGIARSGAYNRTLTPFGFQSERRTLWEATQTYIDVSPLFSADKLDEPILLIHGDIDNNAGTYPLQTRRMFRALQGNGATARSVILPYESHGYVARESILHVLAESFEWFDQYVKGH